VIQRASAGLKAGGRIIILDLLKHDHEWTREQWADQWLGFMPEELSEWLVKAGLDIVRIEILKGFVPDLSVLMAVGVKSV
jgi:ArsR family transcriptional regulator